MIYKNRIKPITLAVLLCLSQGCKTASTFEKLSLENREQVKIYKESMVYDQIKFRKDLFFGTTASVIPLEDNLKGILEIAHYYQGPNNDNSVYNWLPEELLKNGWKSAGYDARYIEYGNVFNGIPMGQSRMHRFAKAVKKREKRLINKNSDYVFYETSRIGWERISLTSSKDGLVELVTIYNYPLIDAGLIAIRRTNENADILLKIKDVIYWKTFEEGNPHRVFFYD